MTINLCYGLDGDEQLQSDPDEVVQALMESTMSDEPFDDWAKRREWPIKVGVFRRMDVKWLAPSLADRVIEDLLEVVDEEHSDPDGNPTEPTEGMKAAARAFVDAVLAEYVSWACEPTVETVEYTQEQARKIWEGMV